MQRHYLSIDIGGTSIKSARIDHSGNIIEERPKLATPHDRDGFLAALDGIVESAGDARALCVSVPGIVNPRVGSVKFTGTLGFMGEFPLADHLKRTGLPVFVGNDANCATLAEMWLGNLRDVNSGAVITLGTSVGGGLMLNGQLFAGPHFRAGELSAIINNYDHADPHAATVGASTSAVRMIAAVATSCSLPNKRDGRRAFVEINQRNPQAWPIFQAFCQRVAVLLVNVQAVLDLDRVLVGGGISAQPIVVAEVRRQFAALQAGDRRLRADIEMPDIQAAKFGNEANLLGALYGFLLAFEEN